MHHRDLKKWKRQYQKKKTKTKKNKTGELSGNKADRKMSRQKRNATNNKITHRKKKNAAEYKHRKQ